jgi:hypothetical protein
MGNVRLERQPMLTPSQAPRHRVADWYGKRVGLTLIFRTKFEARYNRRGTSDTRRRSAGALASAMACRG